MPSLWSSIKSYFSGDLLAGLSGATGIPPEKTEGSLKDTLSVMLAGLAKNAKSPEGATSLSEALKKDHDGSVFQASGKYLAHPEEGKGKGILDNIFGANVGNVENYISTHNGLEPGSSKKLLEDAAPLLMGAIGQIKNEQNLDPSNLAGLIEQTILELKTKDSEKYSMIIRLLDKDGDGQITDDIQGLGFMSFILKFFRKK